LRFTNTTRFTDTLPPVVIYDMQGHPLLSWRVLILPFLEQAHLYNQFRLDEAWDSPHNLALTKKMPKCYRSVHQDDPDLTHYQVLVGPQTAFEKDRLSWSDFPDGPGNTILIVEAAEFVPWTKPIDLPYDPEKPLPHFGEVSSKPIHFLCREIGRRTGFYACFGDGSVRFIGSTTDERFIRGLITRNGGEITDMSELE
jgi:hypothetical protein